MRSLGVQADEALGASEINISCVIEERDAVRALNIIHTSMFTFLD
jgi:aspartate kinase